MLKEGDWLLCKNDYYEGDLIDNNGVLIGKKYMGVRKFFEKPRFKEGTKYQIKKVIITTIPTGGTGGLYNSFASPYYYTYISYSIERADKREEEFSDRDIKVIFYTKQQERGLKLKKLNEGSL